MSKELSLAEKIRITESDEQFAVTGQSSWVGKKIRKGERHGIVVSDMNGYVRTLVVLFDDAIKEIIEMNNMGPDRRDNSAYEWLCGNKIWFKF